MAYKGRPIYIVNADDFGFDENSNQAIVESFAKGLINQTTIMVNMPHASDAVALAKDAGFFGCVGLHLNLTEGRPLTTEISNCDRICNGTGNFHGAFLSNEALSDQCVRKMVREEIATQIERYLHYGLTLLHCDGHHHVQAQLHLARIIMPILCDYGFVSIRRPANVWKRPWAPHIRSRILQWKFSCLATSHGLSMAEYFTGAANVGDICMRIRRKAQVEVMVHPRYDRNGMLVDVTNFKECRGKQMSEIRDWTGGIRK